MPGVENWPLVTLFYHAPLNAHHVIALRPEGGCMAFLFMSWFFGYLFIPTIVRASVSGPRLPLAVSGQRYLRMSMS